ncbi:unnamed protein product, partial [Ceratitis capitata]
MESKQKNQKEETMETSIFKCMPTTGLDIIGNTFLSQDIMEKRMTSHIRILDFYAFWLNIFSVLSFLKTYLKASVCL